MIERLLEEHNFDDTGIIVDWQIKMHLNTKKVFFPSDVFFLHCFFLEYFNIKEYALSIIVLVIHRNKNIFSNVESTFLNN